jgi:SAM-dependent methyltransferase
VRGCIVCGSGGPFPELFLREPWRLVRCTGCGLVFQDPQPSGEALAGAYYHDAEFAGMLMGPLREVTMRRARQHLRLLEQSAAAIAGPLLDVGCSSGAFLEVARGAGREGVGVEVGEATATAARERGLDVRTGTLAETAVELEAGSFGLVTFWDVLEHLHDPREELRLAFGLLRPGGVLAATMPNVEGLYPRVTHRLLARRSGRWEYPELPVHLYDFAPSTIVRLLSDAGYEQPSTRTFATPFSFYRSTTLSRSALGGGGSALALRAAFELLRLAIYPAARLVDRGNALFVTARRSPSAP